MKRLFIAIAMAVLMCSTLGGCYGGVYYDEPMYPAPYYYGYYPGPGYVYVEGHGWLHHDVWVRYYGPRGYYHGGYYRGGYHGGYRGHR